MNCRTIVDFLLDYVEGRLPEGQRKVFDAHLDECSACVRYLDTYRRTLEFEQALRRCESAPSEVPDDLLRTILEARRRTS